MIGKHLLIWLLVILLTPLVTPYVLSPQSLSLYIRNDYNAAIAVLGEQNEINEPDIPHPRFKIFDIILSN